MKEIAKDEFVIKVDYEPNTIEPSKVFKSMAELIESMGSIDRVLLEPFPFINNSQLVLEEIAVGSLMSKLKSSLLSIPDEALGELSIQKAIGHYFVKAKYKIIESIKEKETLVSSEEVEEIKMGIKEVAKEELGQDINISTAPLLKSLSMLSDALKELGDTDRAFYISQNGFVAINKTFNLSTDQIEELMTNETTTFERELILQVKKPDYIGHSKWTFYYDRKMIDVKITDVQWLLEFQAGDIDLRPGDSLRASVKIELGKDDKGVIVSEAYNLRKVKDIIKKDKFDQLSLEL